MLFTTFSFFHTHTHTPLVFVLLTGAESLAPAKHSFPRVVLLGGARSGRVRRARHHTHRRRPAWRILPAAEVCTLSTLSKLSTWTALTSMSR